MSVESEMDSAAVTGRKPLAVEPMRYLKAFGGGVSVAMAVYCGLYLMLHLTGNLPPPPLSNSVCVDQKLEFLRNHPPDRPNVLLLGSSVAWRNLDSSVIAREATGAKPLNAGFCGMQIHNSAFIGNWLINHLPSVEQVVLLVSPMDYRECGIPAQVFNTQDADGYVFQHKAAWRFHLRYFDPVSLVRNIPIYREDRQQAHDMGVAMEFTEYGDGPLATTENGGVRYGLFPESDPACFAALRFLAEEFGKRGRRFMVVTTPIHPTWKEKFDPKGTYIDAYYDRIAAALEGTGAEIWNADRAGVLDSQAFWDAIHIRWSAASVFTREIVRNLRL